MDILSCQGSLCGAINNAQNAVPQTNNFGFYCYTALAALALIGTTFAYMHSSHQVTDDHSYSIQNTFGTIAKVLFVGTATFVTVIVGTAASVFATFKLVEWLNQTRIVIWLNKWLPETTGEGDQRDVWYEWN